MSVAFVEEIKNKAKTLYKTVAFPDAEDVRAINAAVILNKEKIAKPVLIGNESNIKAVAEDNNIDINGIKITDPVKSALIDEFADILYRKRKEKGMTEEEAREMVKLSIYFAGQLLKTGRVDVVVGGNISATGDIIRAAIYTVGVAEGISVVSSYFIMVFPDKKLCFVVLYPQMLILY